MTDPARPRIAPFGSWVSPVTADLIVGESIRLGQVAIDGNTIYWTEGRPREQGRNVLVAHTADDTADGTIADVSPAPFNVRTRAHEYGGGAFTVARGEVVISHDADQQLYRIGISGAPEALTRSTNTRYADGVIDAQRQLLIAVREDHGSSAPEAVNALVAIDLQTGAERVIAGGHDFFSNPRLSPDGQQLAWLTWDHPNMPWDGTELWLAPVAGDGSLGPAHRVAGGKAESIFQPSWSPQGELHFVSDRSGWWNLYRQRGSAIQALHPMEAEFGEAQWAFGMSTYGFDAGSRVVCTCAVDGDSRLYVIESATLEMTEIATPFRVILDLQVGAGFVAFVGGSASAPEAVIKLDLASGGHEVIRSASGAVPDAAYTSVAEAIAFPTEGGLVAHAFHYPPANADFRGPEGEHPPLIVVSHGGPTGATTAAFEWRIQYWTSRGFAVVDVNYGGSEGYGRAYRQRLTGLWGVVDVDDSVNAARYLIERGDANAERVAIRGGSAGGYTTLCALTFRSFFKAGASHYGIGDLEALARDTHKFESRYLDGLIGPWPTQRALYLERSPVNHTDRLESPMILFQGNEDKAVPPNQAQAMYDAVRAKGLPVAYLLFESEQHGFRRADTIKRVLEAELYFYGRIFGFMPADAIEPVAIGNLPEPA